MESTKLKVITVTSVLTGLSLAGITLPGIAYAEKIQEADSIAEAFGEKSFHNLELRLRHEAARDRAPTNLSGTGTQDLRWSRLNSLRTMLTYGTGAVCDTSAQATMTNVTTFFGTKKHNPNVPSVTGRTDYTVINEPRGTALNELWVQNNSIPDTNVRVGNQFFTLDNERFFGKSDYQQNPQSYRGVTVANNSIMDTTITYGFIRSTLRNDATTRDDGRENRQNTHLLHANWHGYDCGSVSVYGHRIKDKDARVLSSTDRTFNFATDSEFYSAKNYGIRFSGDSDVENYDGLNVNYEAEYAKQHGKYNNPVNYHAHYWVAGLGASMNGFDLGLRHEVLSGSAGSAGEQFKFSGSEHEFLGNADVFTLTPMAGIKDTMLRVGYTHDDCWHFRADGHSFRPQNGGGTRFGRELDLSAKYDITKNYNVGLAYAKFRAKDGNTGSATGTVLGNVTKYWLTLGANF